MRNETTNAFEDPKLRKSRRCVCGNFELDIVGFFLLGKMMISSSMWVLTWFSPKTPPSWKIFITDVKPIGSMYAICTYMDHIKNDLRIHGSIFIYIIVPWDLLTIMGKKTKPSSKVVAYWCGSYEKKVTWSGSSKGGIWTLRHPPLVPVGAVLVTVGFFMGVCWSLDRFGWYIYY